MQAETKGEALFVIGNSMSKGMDVAECSVYASIKWKPQRVSETKREKSFGAYYAIPQCPAKDNELSPDGAGETLKVLKQGSACAGRPSRGEAGQTSLLLESVAWSFVPFRTFGLDLKSLFILQLLPTIQLDRDSVLWQIPLLHQSLKP